MISLCDQLKEAKRELALRRRVYPGFIQRGKMTGGASGVSHCGHGSDLQDAGGHGVSPTGIVSRAEWTLTYHTVPLGH